MKRYICTRETYEKDGEEKASFNRIGELFEAKNGKTYCKLYFMPGVLLSVFEDNKAEKKPANKPLDPDLNPDENVPF